MKATFTLLAPFFLAARGLAAPPPSQGSPVLLADLNHDGLADDRDAISNNSDGRAAYFLPNIGVTGDHCPERDLNNRPLSDEELGRCHDGKTNSIFDPEIFAPLRTLPLKCPDDAIGEVHVLPRRHARRVRLFVKTGNAKKDWTYLDAEAGLNATLMRQGVELGIDSRELVTDREVWDGRVSLEFVVKSSNKTSSSPAVPMQMAPALTTHHLQKVQRIAVVNETYGTNIFQPAFVKRLDQVRQDLNLSTPLLTLVAGDPELPQDIAEGGYHDAWTQDAYQEALASIPAPDGAIKSVRIYLRPAQSTRGIARQLFTTLRGSGGTGAHAPGGFGRREVNGYGNVETIPPYGDYPAGRVLLTKHWDLQPTAHLLDFFRAQGKDGGMQEPLIVEGGFMFAGHIDEIISFIPNPNAKYGWSLSIADVDAALEALKNASDRGHGDTPAFGDVWEFTPGEDLTGLTIDELLSNDHFQWSQNYARKYLRNNLEILKQETGIEESDVIRVPVLYHGVDVLEVFPPATERTENGMVPPRCTVKPGELKLQSLYPSALNSLIVENDVVCAKQWGPIVEGKDIMAEAVEKAFDPVARVHYIDTLKAHHVFGGEVHCATNTLRDGQQWW